MSELGDLLKDLRGNKSLRKVAEETGLSHSYISDVEKGYRRDTKTPINPSPDTLKRLSDAYRYPYKKLLEVAGYIEEDNDSEEYNPLDEINELLKKYDIDQSGFFDIEKWKAMGPDEIRELESYFEYITSKAKKKEQEND